MKEKYSKRETQREQHRDRWTKEDNHVTIIHLQGLANSQILPVYHISHPGIDASIQRVARQK